MIYLVDANVLSEPTKPQPNEKVIQWLTAHEPDVSVDSIILGELLMGIVAVPAGRRKDRLRNWFEELAATLVCLPWDASVARRWAELVVQLKKTGKSIPLLDAMIAATALEHDLIVVTRNERHFDGTGVKVVNPFL